MYHDGQQWIHGDYNSFYTTTTFESTLSIRLVVHSSPYFKSGQIVLIDENGLTIGRDRSWDRRLRLPEMAISKYHCLIFLNPKTARFYICDVGSQHGTTVNGQRLSEPKKSSLPHPLEHLDRIQVGSTTLVVHLHQTGPCEDCITQEFIDLSCGKKEKKATTTMTAAAGMQELASDKRDWMKVYKQAYQVDDVDPLKDEDYVDRAKLRRKEYVDNTPIPLLERTLPEKSYYGRNVIANLRGRMSNAENTMEDGVSYDSNPNGSVQGVGNIMLKKLGWQEGQSLGKHQTGIKEPIQPVAHNSRAGLGMRE